MFRFTRRPSSRSHGQYFAKIIHLVQCGYVELVQDIIVMAAYCDLWGVCAVYCVSIYAYTVHSTHASQVIIWSIYSYTVHSTHASQVIICSYNTDDVLYDLHVSATVFTNPTLATLELNLGLHGEKLWWLTAWAMVLPHFINSTKTMSVVDRNQNWGLA